MIDCVLRIPDASMMQNRNALKLAVASIFGDRHDGQVSRYLFSAEPRHEQGPWVRVRFLAGPLPSAAQTYATKIELDDTVVGQTVQIMAWVALKATVFNGTGDLRPRIQTGLERVCRQRLDAALDIERIEVGGDCSIVQVDRGKDRIGRAFGRVEITGTIKDQDAVETLMSSGIGAAKAYGFGLVDIQSVRDI